MGRLFSAASPENDPNTSIHKLLTQRTLVIASNRGPVTLRVSEDNDLEYQRGSGGLVTALIGVLQHAEAQWIASAQTDADRAWQRGEVPLGESDETVWMEFVSPSGEAYEGYYGVISNPLLWFLQHSMWNIFREPTIDQATWCHWDEGYVRVNTLFAKAIARQINAVERPALVMLQDYHVYGTAEAMHQALTMSPEERQERAGRLRALVESHDIVDWLHQQLSAVIRLKL